MNVLIKILKKPIASAVIAILFGFCIAAIVLAAAGYNPGAAFAELFRGALGRSNYISNVIIKATPLLFCGIGISFAYKAGLFNIGSPSWSGRRSTSPCRSRSPSCLSPAPRAARLSAPS